MSTNMFPFHPEREIVSSRVFNVSKPILFSYFSDPDKLKKSWGPAGFSNTFHCFEFKEGGIWDFVMHGPEKGNYKNTCKFIKIESPNLIAWKRHTQPYFNVEFSFESRDEQSTELLFRMIFDSIEECEKLKKYVGDKNEENFDKLKVEIGLELN